MPIQPLEVYQVEETGELVLFHKDLKESLVSHSAVMIVNHNDKLVVLWIGKGSSTRSKFAAARASRRFLTERGLSYRVKTCDEGDEPDWFDNLFKIKVSGRSRDEPPSLEILAILNEIKVEQVPEGYEREACIVSRDFFVPVEHKTTIMGKDTSTIKFETSSYLPEGFFTLPSVAYRPRLLVRNGKILGIDLLVNYTISKEDLQSEEIHHLQSDKKLLIDKLSNEIEEKDQRIEALEQNVVEKNQIIEEKNLKIRTFETGDLQLELSKRDQLVEELMREVSEKSLSVKDLTQKLEESQSISNSLKLEVLKKEEVVGDLRNAILGKDQKIESLQQEIIAKDSEIETIQRNGANKEFEIEELTANISKKDKEIQEKCCIIEEIEEELRNKSRKIQELEAK